VQRVTAEMLAGQGDLLPVSAFPIDGTWPTGHHPLGRSATSPGDPAVGPRSASSATSARWSARTPPSAPRSTRSRPSPARRRPSSTAFKGKEFPNQRYTLQVAPEDCTGCTLCVQVCPAKDKTNPRTRPSTWCRRPRCSQAERENWDFFLNLPDVDRTQAGPQHGQGHQFCSRCSSSPGACAGCGETPYLKLLTQLFGDRLLIANATGCSSIYGGNLPTTPYCTNADGRGPAWANSLFEDNAEFGLGMRLAVEHRAAAASCCSGSPQLVARRWPASCSRPTRRPRQASSPAAQRSG
jgi:pyruvate-ferredoxin/flavodoxin oxidoreductase